MPEWTSRCLDGLAAGWFIDPAVGLASIVIMISYHAVASEGLHQGPPGRFIRRRQG
jgi:hypothetical protein